MSSNKEYLHYILLQLSGLRGITYRAMMGEFVLYYQNKVIGGIFDDRFLVKPVNAAKQLMPNAKYEIPYKGGKEMILVDDIDDQEFLMTLIKAMYDELPEPKPKKAKSSSL